jgi:alpha-mannosidase
MLETPGAQLHGTHRFELAVYPHRGDWHTDVHAVAETYTYPLRATVTRKHSGSLPANGRAIEIEPDAVELSALQKTGNDLRLRVYNASPEPTDARIHVSDAFDTKEASVVGLLGDERQTLTMHDRFISLPLKPWEIATVRLR